MDLRLSARVRRLQPSPTLAVTARAAELRAAGADIIGLGAGEPDFDTPEPIKEAAIHAIRAGQTKYTAVDGTPELKQAIINKFARENDLHYEPSQILVSCGAKHTFFNLCQALLQDGDEVIIPAPYWVSYPEIVQVADGKSVIISAGIEQNFKISPRQLNDAITPRTRMVVLNSPSNPTGKVYSRVELEQLGDVLRRHPQVLIATDDMYEHIFWGAEPFCNLAMACPDLYGRTIVMNGVSKAYAMTGWRIGYAGGPRPLIQAMKNIQSQSTSNPASMSQAAARAALEGDQACVTEMCRAFHERHDFVYENLSTMKDLRIIAGDGTFYAFADFSAVIARISDAADDVALGEKLLQDAGLALVPGSAFGAPGYMRLSFATSLGKLRIAMTRLRGFLET